MELLWNIKALILLKYDNIIEACKNTFCHINEHDIIIIIIFLYNLTTFLLIVQSQTVTIRVKGHEHTYHHTSELDNYSINGSPVSPPDAKLQLSWVYLL